MKEALTNDDISALVGNYYSEKLALFGATPLGVDWNSEEAQIIRFRQFERLYDQEKSFSINDYGCGYGALLTYLTETGASFKYLGIDCSESMIRECHKGFKASEHHRFVCTSRLDERADFTVASGIFNVRLDVSEENWKNYTLDTITQMNSVSTKGFGFNILTSYSDPERQREDLFYADPLWFFDYCKRNFAKDVALLHDYRVYEFTILVRK